MSSILLLLTKVFVFERLNQQEGKVEAEEFTDQLYRELKSTPQPCLVPFLKVRLNNTLLSPFGCQHFLKNLKRVTDSNTRPKTFNFGYSMPSLGISTRTGANLIKTLLNFILFSQPQSAMLQCADFLNDSQILHCEHFSAYVNKNQSVKKACQLNMQDNVF